NARQAQRAGLRGRDREGAGRDTRSCLRRDRASDDREFLPSVLQSAAQRGGRGVSLTVTILGCGSSGGVPRPALRWGACDPNHPKNRRRRTAILVERGMGPRTRVLVDTPPDLREQLLDAAVDWVDGVLFTHEHADHTHGIDDLRGAFIHRKRRVDAYLYEATARVVTHRFDYCFGTPPGRGYPPILNERRLVPGTPVRIDGEGVRSTCCPSCRTMATSPRSDSVSAASPIRPTSSDCMTRALRRSLGWTSGSWTRC